jgi:3',5'-cyclic AMP phosphodiesterase CpdA
MFVLAHLSDPHLAPLPQPRLTELIGKRVTGYLNWQRNRQHCHRSDVLKSIVDDLKAQSADHIAVTGDLVNISLAAEYAPAQAWLAALGNPHDVSLVPGNHDAYVRAAARFPELHWGDYMRGDDAGEPGAAMFPFLRRRDDLALIGLSTAVPTSPLMATGRLGAQQLARLAELLERTGREGLFRVVLIHHPPRSSRPNYFKRLTDGKAMRRVLARHGAELVLHGHDHMQMTRFLDGPHRYVPVIGVPSASGAVAGDKDPAAYNLFRIERNASAWRWEMVTRGFFRNGDKIVELKRSVSG